MHKNRYIITNPGNTRTFYNDQKMPKKTSVTHHSNRRRSVPFLIKTKIYNRSKLLCLNSTWQTRAKCTHTFLTTTRPDNANNPDRKRGTNASHLHLGNYVNKFSSYTHTNTHTHRSTVSSHILCSRTSCDTFILYNNPIFRTPLNNDFHRQKYTHRVVCVS